MKGDIKVEIKTSTGGDELMRLRHLLSASSKHSHYQTLHPSLKKILKIQDSPLRGKYELERQNYIGANTNIREKKVFDIGANSGFFSFLAAQSGAAIVVAQEGNVDHANFIRLASKIMGLEEIVEVRPSYYDFHFPNDVKYDITFCLNVLHHLGDDFDEKFLDMVTAKNRMIDSLNSLAKNTETCWMQLGFNWMGNISTPLFDGGTKAELINFVVEGASSNWVVEDIAIFNPKTQAYEGARKDLMARFDEIGEFLNRPLFLLRSLSSL